MTDLAALTTLRVGGPARALVEATTEEDLLLAVRSAAPPVLVLAGGSNVVVADAGFDGTVVRVATRGVRRRRGGSGALGGSPSAGRAAFAEDAPTAVIEVAAGEPWDDVVAFAVSSGLAGIECLSGIPGSTGATPIQNVGAYGQEVSQTIDEVRVYDREAERVEMLPAAACGFAYRSSRFRGSDRWVVLGVTFALVESSLSEPVRYAELARVLGIPVGARAPLAEVRDAVLALRRGKGMVIDPGDPDSVSAGSFFTNPILDAEGFAALEARAVAAGAGSPPGWPEPDGRIKTSAAWLIERSGFSRGYGEGPAGLSTKHTLAIVNRGGARAADIVALAQEIAGVVFERFAVALVPEPVFVGLVWDF